MHRMPYKGAAIIYSIRERICIKKVLLTVVHVFKNLILSSQNVQCIYVLYLCNGTLVFFCS